MYRSLQEKENEPSNNKNRGNVKFQITNLFFNTQFLLLVCYI